jgi:hypothetical protein
MTIPQSRSAERGVGLAEQLVAVGLFALATVIALSQLDAARSAIKLGSNRAELQQSLRAAADQMMYDLRRAGLEVEPDESIEMAGSTALVFRAGGIVGYVLAKPARASEGEFSFEVGGPESVSVSNVALIHEAPPYTLYRISVKPGSSRAARTPVIDNVRSLRFTYLDGDGSVFCDSCEYEDKEEEILRASIRHVRVELTGQTRDPDPAWVDPFDPEPTRRHYRTRTLTFEIRPRNLGLPHVATE